MKLKYFSLSEFDCPSLSGSSVNMDANFLSMLDKARDIAGIPFKINSGYRTAIHNATLKNSKPNSAHLEGKAADIAVSDSRSRYIIVQALIKAGFNRIGIAKTFIHCDNSDTKSADVIWMY